MTHSKHLEFRLSGGPGVTVNLYYIYYKCRYIGLVCHLLDKNKWELSSTWANRNRYLGKDDWQSMEDELQMSRTNMLRTVMHFIPAELKSSAVKSLATYEHSNCHQ